MTLFFYGAIETQNDEASLKQFMDKWSKDFVWEINTKSEELDKLTQALGLTASSDYLVFELGFSQQDNYEAIYGDYRGDKMLQYYRLLASQLKVQSAESLDFMSNDLVTEHYRHNPSPDLPLIRFLASLFDTFPDREIRVALDHDFENRFSCTEIKANAKTLLMVAWNTIAFGYQLPNLRLIFNDVV